MGSGALYVNAPKCTNQEQRGRYFWRNSHDKIAAMITSSLQPRVASPTEKYQKMTNEATRDWRQPTNEDETNLRQSQRIVIDTEEKPIYLVSAMWLTRSKTRLE